MSDLFPGIGENGARIIYTRSRFDYAVHHISTAALFTRQAYQIETNFDGNIYSPLVQDYMSYVTGAILTSVSFLESMINELFTDTTAAYPPNRYYKKVDPTTRDLMADMWKLGIPKTAKYSILEKYQIALALARKTPLDFGKSPCQDVQILIRIRNALVHSEPRWVTNKFDELPDDDSLFLFLRSANKFPFNPLFTEIARPFFPDKCLSHGCAVWAVDSSLMFVKEFSRNFGIPDLTDGFVISTKPA